MIKLEAILCSNMLKIFELNNNGHATEADKKYLGFAFVEEEFTERDLENTALLLYSRVIRDIKKAPKIEVEITYS